MADNTTLNLGSGGNTIRDFQDASGNHWAASGACYFVTVSPGANVLQTVDSSHGLPVAQQGTWTVTASQATAASLNATVVGTGTFAVQAAQSGSWSVTANAGTNLNTSALALDTSVNGVLLAQGSTTSGEKGPLVQGAVTTSAPSYTTAQTSPLSLDTSGNLRVNVAAASSLTVSGSVTANAGTNLNTSLLALETGGNLATLAGGITSSKYQTNVAQLAGTTTDTNSGNKSAGTLRVVLATDQPQLTNSLLVSQATAANLNCTATLASGSNVIGHVIVDSGTITTVSSVTAIAGALPSGTNLLGSAAVAQQIAVVYNGTTSVTVQYVPFSTSSSGTTTIVNLSSGKKIYVLRWSVSANGSTNVNLQSHTTTSLATKTCYMTQFKDSGGAWCPGGIMATAASEALDVNNSAAVAISGDVTYVQF